MSKETSTAACKKLSKKAEKQEEHVQEMEGEAQLRDRNDVRKATVQNESRLLRDAKEKQKDRLGVIAKRGGR